VQQPQTTKYAAIIVELYYLHIVRRLAAIFSLTDIVGEGRKDVCSKYCAVIDDVRR